MPKKAKLTIHPAFRIGAISKRLYGAFLEPIGNMVNGTMYNPSTPRQTTRASGATSSGP